MRVSTFCLVSHGSRFVLSSSLKSQSYLNFYPYLQTFVNRCESWMKCVFGQISTSHSIGHFTLLTVLWWGGTIEKQKKNVSNKYVNIIIFSSAKLVEIGLLVFPNLIKSPPTTSSHRFIFINTAQSPSIISYLPHLARRYTKRNEEISPTPLSYLYISRTLNACPLVNFRQLSRERRRRKR